MCKFSGKFTQTLVIATHRIFFETARGFKLDIPSLGVHRPSVFEQSSEVLRLLVFELGLLARVYFNSSCEKNGRGVSDHLEIAIGRVRGRFDDASLVCACADSHSANAGRRALFYQRRL